MAKATKQLPKIWKELGRWYVPDFDRNQEDWREYVELRDKEQLLKSEERRLADLEPIIAEQVEVRIIPYSAEEFDKIEAASRKGLFDAKVDAKGNVNMRGDPVRASETLMLDICRERILEVRNYFKLEAERIDPTTNDVISWKRTPITTGGELVDFIRKEAWSSDELILRDIFSAIKSISHLERGLKKSFRAPSSSSEVGTNP